ncbi:MAG: SUMF1/EgtB/PvdO family nonheme iron enzyme [Planctomycetes bacterium]|nr:SUMF1/EgtB/PvdO family nonheme iron enzyme [Planctomycetota bacterium]
MRPTLSPALAALVVSSLCTLPLATQEPARAVGANGAAKASAKGPAQSPAPSNSALPSDMLPVPGGTFSIGADPKTILDAIEKAFPLSEEKRLDEVTKLYAELGRKSVTVVPFFMGRYPVTNAQYKVFVEKTGHRYPYHWWAEGRKDDLEQRRDAIKAEFPSAKDPYMPYWERHWKELPYAIPSYNGGDTPGEDCPVVYVSWRDANAYAAWLGMRIPTEYEWVWAASGGEPKQYLWGDDPKANPIKRGTKFDKMWPVGHHGDAAVGKFGHGHMQLGVYEWMGEIGFYAFDAAANQSELEKLFKEKLFKGKDSPRLQKALAYRPKFAGEKVVVKGGMFGTENGLDLRIWTRAATEHFQTASALGFRLAKSERPARDYLASLLKLDYDWSHFGGTRKPNIADQTGAERYELGGDGKLVQAYHAVSLAPVSHASDDEKSSIDRLMEATVEQHNPLALATLASTEKLAEPALEPGIYSLCFRHSGMPKPLQDALAQASKDLKLAKTKAGKGELKLDDVSGEWEAPLKRFGITKQDVLDGKVDFVRIGAVKIPTDTHMWVVRNAVGEAVATFPVKHRPETKSKYEEPASLVVDERDSKHLNFVFGVPTIPEARGKAYLVKLEVKLAEAAIDNNWRIAGK